MKSIVVALSLLLATVTAGVAIGAALAGAERQGACQLASASMTAPCATTVLRPRRLAA